MYKRILNLEAILKKANYFLLGPRATGKSSLINEQLKNILIVDLLDDDVYDDLSRRPSSLIEKIEKKHKIVVIDEIQKLPKLMDEIHRIIEKHKIRFLLTGSSARKLRRQGGNMLGGRAREMNLFPLTRKELGKDFNLIKYLNYGGLPIIYKSKEPIDDLKAYCSNYLNEEIKIEAAVRNYDRFSRFLEVLALSNSQELNYLSLSSASGVPARTIEGHIEVIKDTLIGFELLPFAKTIKRKAVTRSKFYFFDCGVATLAANTGIDIEIRRAGTAIATSGMYTGTVSGNLSTMGGTSVLDSPNTTSATTYEVFYRETALAGTVNLYQRRLHLLEVKG
jgi:predicted AAA+ superfamily ATPase